MRLEDASINPAEAKMEYWSFGRAPQNLFKLGVKFAADCDDLPVVELAE